MVAPFAGLGESQRKSREKVAGIAHSSPLPVFCTAPRENGFALVNGWIRWKGKYFMICKLYGIQVSVSIKKILWEHNSIPGVLSIPVPTLQGQLSTWDRNPTWHCHALLPGALQRRTYHCPVLQAPRVSSHFSISLSPPGQNEKCVLIILGI